MHVLPANRNEEPFRPFFVVDEQMRVRLWPEPTARALGISLEKAHGRRCWELFGSSICVTCRDASNPDLAQLSGCTRLRAPAGESGWLVWSPLALIAAGPVGSALFESLMVRGALAECLVRYSLEETLERIRHACAADDCELFLLDPELSEVSLCGCVGLDRDAFLECTRMPLGVGYPGWVTANGKPLYTSHFQQDQRFQRRAVKQRGIHTFIGVPLIESGSAIGYLGLGWKAQDIPIDWGLHLLESVRPVATAAARLDRRPRSAPTARRAALRCLGGFSLVGEAASLAAADFPRRKALDLLCHLLLARGAALPRDALIERLWPDVDPDTGANRLHVTLHVLRRVLGKILPQRPSPIQHRRGRYRLDPDALGPVDAFEFSDALDQARTNLRAGNPDAAQSCLERAVSLYRGELFADAEDLAFEAPRQRFRDRHCEALRLLVDLYLRTDRIDAALAALTVARECAAGDGDWHDALLRQVVERRHLPRGAAAAQAAAADDLVRR